MSRRVVRDQSVVGAVARSAVLAAEVVPARSHSRQSVGVVMAQVDSVVCLAAVRVEDLLQVVVVLVPAESHQVAVAVVTVVRAEDFLLPAVAVALAEPHQVVAQIAALLPVMERLVRVQQAVPVELRQAVVPAVLHQVVVDTVVMRLSFQKITMREHPRTWES